MLVSATLDAVSSPTTVEATLFLSLSSFFAYFFFHPLMPTARLRTKVRIAQTEPMTASTFPVGDRAEAPVAVVLDVVDGEAGNDEEERRGEDAVVGWLDEAMRVVGTTEGCVEMLPVSEVEGISDPDSTNAAPYTSVLVTQSSTCFFM